MALGHAAYHLQRDARITILQHLLKKIERARAGHCLNHHMSTPVIILLATILLICAIIALVWFIDRRCAGLSESIESLRTPGNGLEDTPESASATCSTSNNPFAFCSLSTTTRTETIAPPAPKKQKPMAGAAPAALYKRRECARKYAARIRNERISAGMCPVCGERPPEPGRKACAQCAEKARLAGRKRYRKAHGIAEDAPVNSTYGGNPVKRNA